MVCHVKLSSKTKVWKTRFFVVPRVPRCHTIKTIHWPSLARAFPEFCGTPNLALRLHLDFNDFKTWKSGLVLQKLMDIWTNHCDIPLKLSFLCQIKLISHWQMHCWAEVRTHLWTLFWQSCFCLYGGGFSMPAVGRERLHKDSELWTLPVWLTHDSFAAGRVEYEKTDQEVVKSWIWSTLEAELYDKIFCNFKLCTENNTKNVSDNIGILNEHKCLVTRISYNCKQNVTKVEICIKWSSGH